MANALKVCAKEDVSWNPIPLMAFQIALHLCSGQFVLSRLDNCPQYIP